MFGELDYEAGCRRLMTAGPSTVIVTLGSRGSVGLTEQDGFFKTESFQVPVRDTTGAGDVFHGAYIVGLLEGMNAPECARFASAVSAIKCTCFGGRTGDSGQKDSGGISGNRGLSMIRRHRSVWRITEITFNRKIRE